MEGESEREWRVMQCLRVRALVRDHRGLSAIFLPETGTEQHRGLFGRGRNAVEDPSTAFLLREEWRRASRRQGKKAARRVALRLRLWPDRRFERPWSRRP